MAVNSAAEHAHQGAADAPAPTLSPRDLAELLGAFNEASRKLQDSHEVLRSEVSRLKAELAQANEALERSRRLAALGEMAAGIAHEVRNPLGSIRLYAKMLVDDLVDRAGERKIAERIGVAVRGLDMVVGDVLAFSREMRIDAADHDASDLFDRAVEEVLADDGVFGSEGARPRVLRLDRDGAPLALRCDAALTHRALVNIIRNAVQAMAEQPPGIERTLVLGAAAERRVGARGEARHWAILSIRDTGGGIPEEARERIFNPFFTTRATGTGLGLAIVHRTMDAHSGAIGVSTVEGGRIAGHEQPLARGALVELLFPSQAAEPAAAENGNELIEIKGPRRRTAGAGAGRH